MPSLGADMEAGTLVEWRVKLGDSVKRGDVVADVETDTLNLDPVLAAEKIGPRTRAVLVVHLFGRAARTEGLVEACAGRAVARLEDAAQSIGARAQTSSVVRAVGALGRGAATAAVAGTTRIAGAAVGAGRPA